MKDRALLRETRMTASTERTESPARRPRRFFGWWMLAPLLAAVLWFALRDRPRPLTPEEVRSNAIRARMPWELQSVTVEGMRRGRYSPLETTHDLESGRRLGLEVKYEAYDRMREWRSTLKSLDPADVDLTQWPVAPPEWADPRHVTQRVGSVDLGDGRVGVYTYMAVIGEVETDDGLEPSGEQSQICVWYHDNEVIWWVTAWRLAFWGPRPKNTAELEAALDFDNTMDLIKRLFQKHAEQAFPRPAG